MSELNTDVSIKDMAEHTVALVQDMAEYHIYKRRQILLARQWDEFMGTGMASGAIAGKNESIRHGEAIAINPDLYLQLSVATDDALAAEHSLKERMVVDKFMGRMLKMRELELGTNTLISNDFDTLKKLSEGGG